MNLLVSMPQSARATFKPGLPGSSASREPFQCLNRHEQPSSRASGLCLRLPLLFQCLNRHEQPSSRSAGQQARVRAYVSMPQSARATFKLLWNIFPLKLLQTVSMPQSARATFKPHAMAGLARLSGSFNASIGTSNLQARVSYMARNGRICFNASIGTSNLQAKITRNIKPQFTLVSMPQSARATFKHFTTSTAGR